MSGNVWFAFGGVLLLGLIGFLVAWFADDADRSAKTADKDPYTHQLLVTFRDFDEEATRLSVSQEHLRRLMERIRESLLSEHPVESSKKVRT